MRAQRILYLSILSLACLVIAMVWYFQSTERKQPSFSQTAQSGELSVTMEIDEATVGTRRFDVTVQDTTGQTVDVREVYLRFSIPEIEMGLIEAYAQPSRSGQFQARGPFFTTVGLWEVETTIFRDDMPAQTATFTVVVAAEGEASGPLNPFTASSAVIDSGRNTYQNHCVSCHGATGQGDGPQAISLPWQPANLTEHMVIGKHTDGQVFLWVQNGIPNSAMPAFGQDLSEEEIWQLVTYLRTLPQDELIAEAYPVPTLPTPEELPDTQSTAPTATAVPMVDTDEPLPPVVFARQSNLWISDGEGAPARQLTELPPGNAAWAPMFAPDGQAVAFIMSSPPSDTATSPLPTTALYLINTDGSHMRALWQPEQALLGHIAWKPDSQSLLVSSDEWQTTEGKNESVRITQIVEVDLATGQPREVVRDAKSPTLNQDTSLLAYIRILDGYKTALEVANIDGSNPRLLVAAAQFEEIYAPRFLPNSEQILFAGLDGPPIDSEGFPIASHSPSIPEMLLGILKTPTAAAHGPPYNFWRINADGSGLRRLNSFEADEPIAAFAPDASQIVFIDGNGIYLMNSDGSDVRRIDSVGEHGGGIDWSPP
ncbi:MAG: hypothetical protein GFH27_549333n68 [Chloroflexi bacterium AL-W]|nr:hypothetical protein [Chloroflexi bacterium AL-N1]NOK70479.1 hypothetical protein [Chloroflexi bacterium AL-N10]NOK78162.1 hypothetical protein [Chloroflexi bacterium AL-N5]NOK85261.1 hypothetical protein [Chloroflexi bacterium AL-W]NOK92026.1 hypothetical protein [Chloroflexi bacterium AL-N15]